MAAKKKATTDEDSTEPFFLSWMDRANPYIKFSDLVVLTERDGARDAAAKAVIKATTDHLVGLEIIERIGGFPEAAAFIRNKLPTRKRVRSGDLGEILASEYIDQCMEYSVPIKRLRWKDDRDTTMRGNDVIAFRIEDGACLILKAESKSRMALNNGVVTEAVEGLIKHNGRPNPSSLAFISARLRETGLNEQAEIFEALQKITPKAANVEHLVFTFSGNDPATYLKSGIDGIELEFRRHLVGCMVTDHQAFINKTFEDLNGGKL